MPLPEGLPALRATLIPTLETALNAIWDSECGTMDKVGIVGGGVVGLLIAFLLRSVWEIDPRIIEIDQKRRKRIEMLDWGLTVIDPADRGNGAFSLCFHASGNEQGLQTAIDRVGFEGRVLELSWFGNRPVQLNLGGSFHFERKQIISSQVNTVARPRRNTLNHRQRLEIAVEHLKNVSLDALISRVISFHELPEFMDRLYVQNPDGLACAVCYPAAPHIG
jgi:threonine dehydrogenase-like Zn-dependent dehydrogenase